MRHPLRPYLRWSLTRQLQQQCKAACAAAYVTEYTLQQRYPCSRYSVGVSDIVLSSTTPLNDAVFETHFSSIDLQQDAYAKEPRRYPRDATRPAIRLLTVGSLEQRYKGVHVLLEALQHCASRGLDATLTVVGDGRYRNELERQTGKLNLAPRVMFLGKLQPGAAVRAEMDKADVFILASLTEGLPRVMIEAMARAMPCIGTHVGGVPELLLQEDMATPGDAGALAGKIMEVAASEARMRKMSAYNLAKAREFHEPILAERRSLFYRHLRSAMENWLAERKALTRRLA
jgi:glycosyltransferase involved in cell wall biosynthesis